MTLRDVIAVEMATIAAPLDDVVSFLLATVPLRAGFAAARRRPRSARSSRWASTSSSSRSSSADGIDARGSRGGAGSIHAPERLDGDSSVPQAVSDVCGADRPSAPTSRVFDGLRLRRRRLLPDRCVAPSERTRVFARDGLADLPGPACGVAFESFEDFYDVAAALDGGELRRVPPSTRPGSRRRRSAVARTASRPDPRSASTAVAARSSSIGCSTAW